MQRLAQGDISLLPAQTQVCLCCQPPHRAASQDGALDWRRRRGWAVPARGGVYEEALAPTCGVVALLLVLWSLARLQWLIQAACTGMVSLATHTEEGRQGKERAPQTAVTPLDRCSSSLYVNFPITYTVGKGPFPGGSSGDLEKGAFFSIITTTKHPDISFGPLQFHTYIRWSVRFCAAYTRTFIRLRSTQRKPKIKGAPPLRRPWWRYGNR
jgi:hypothetical protein